jgi:carbon-monoxide dehydrogenase small subunit/xanthine dehydrogenase YagT iron-sulfur-binding subunit
MAAKMSRRTFLRGSTLGTAMVGWADPADAVAGQAIGRTRGAPAALGPEAVEISLMVNGAMRRLSVEPRTTLAEALRGPLELTGTKVACNRGACSACTVLLDEVPVCSCTLLAIEIGSRKVTTIEGLAQGTDLHPVQDAFIKHDAVQCGFCTPGLVLSCASLLKRNSAPGGEEIRRAISGHVCRCGVYPHVLAAVQSLSKSTGG